MSVQLTAGAPEACLGGDTSEGTVRGAVMKARQHIAGAAYSPDELRIICEAFDDAWAEVTPTSVPVRVRSKLPG